MFPESIKVHLNSILERYEGDYVAEQTSRLEITSLLLMRMTSAQRSGNSIFRADYCTANLPHHAFAFILRGGMISWRDRVARFLCVGLVRLNVGRSSEYQYSTQDLNLVSIFRERLRASGGKKIGDIKPTDQPSARSSPSPPARLRASQPLRRPTDRYRA